MKKVKHISATFFHSFIPQDVYYPKLLHSRFLFSLKYYLFIIIFFACVFTGIVLYRFSPLKILSYKNSIINSLATFPRESEILIKNGVLESNQNKPLFLWVYNAGQPLFVFMAHTEEVLTSSSIPLPLIFFGEEKVQISYRGTRIIRPYNHAWNIHITQEKLQSHVGYVDSFFPAFVFFFYLILVFMVPLTFMASATFIILLSSLLVFILLRTFIPHLHLKKCIQAGMHGTHIPLIITILLLTLFPSSSNVLIVSASLIFVFTLVAVYEMYSETLTHSKGR